jgi:hypothetical protein
MTTRVLFRVGQSIKREHGVESQWLFPSSAWRKADKHYEPNYLGTRLNELIALIQKQAPFESPVEGAAGNLVYFDLSTLDPYSFRHAFAQRLADATDEFGRPTTAPDVLQDFMGHKSFNTTMGYYEVTTKRRKKALEAIPARRLDLHGHVVQVDRERDGFGKIAVTLGHCTEPQNVASGDHSCPLDHACESCPFFLVDPLERDGMAAKRQHLRVNLERASVINSPQHMLDHYAARISDCTRIIDAIDKYVEGLGEAEQAAIRKALETMDIARRSASVPRRIDLRPLFSGGS